VAWLIEDLIASAKLYASIPTAQATFQTADFLRIANEELLTYVVPLVTSQREDFFIAHYDVLLQNGVTEYRIPPRAVGTSLRTVWVISPQSRLIKFPRISRDDLEGASTGFYLDGNILSLVVDDPNNVSQIGTALRMTYHIRPNTLVASTAVGTISNINTGTKQVTVSSAPGTFSSTARYDLLRGRSGFEHLGIDLSATVAGGVLTFTDTLPADLVTGDVVALAGEGNYPQIPVELHPLLARRVAMRCLEVMGDNENLQSCASVLARMEADAVKIITPRVPGNVERLVNRGSPFRLSW
jgi:hypothetical protein